MPSHGESGLDTAFEPLEEVRRESADRPYDVPLIDRIDVLALDRRVVEKARLLAVRGADVDEQLRRFAVGTDVGRGDDGDNRGVQPRIEIVILDNDGRPQLRPPTGDERDGKQDHVAAANLVDGAHRRRHRHPWQASPTPPLPPSWR